MIVPLKVDCGWRHVCGMHNESEVTKQSRQRRETTSGKPNVGTSAFAKFIDEARKSIIRETPGIGREILIVTSLKDTRIVSVPTSVVVPIGRHLRFACRHFTSLPPLLSGSTQTTWGRRRL